MRLFAIWLLLATVVSVNCDKSAGLLGDGISLMDSLGFETSGFRLLKNLYDGAVSQENLLLQRRAIKLLMRACNFILGYLPLEPVRPNRQLEALDHLGLIKFSETNDLEAAASRNVEFFVEIPEAGRVEITTRKYGTFRVADSRPAKFPETTIRKNFYLGFDLDPKNQRKRDLGAVAEKLEALSEGEAETARRLLQEVNEMVRVEVEDIVDDEASGVAEGEFTLNIETNSEIVEVMTTSTEDFATTPGDLSFQDENEATTEAFTSANTAEAIADVEETTTLQFEAESVDEVDATTIAEVAATTIANAEETTVAEVEATTVAAAPEPVKESVDVEDDEVIILNATEEPSAAPNGDLVNAVLKIEINHEESNDEDYEATDLFSVRPEDYLEFGAKLRPVSKSDPATVDEVTRLSIKIPIEETSLQTAESKSVDVVELLKTPEDFPDAAGLVSRVQDNINRGGRFIVSGAAEPKKFVYVVVNKSLIASPAKRRDKRSSATGHFAEAISRFRQISPNFQGFSANHYHYQPQRFDPPRSYKEFLTLRPNSQYSDVKTYLKPNEDNSKGKPVIAKENETFIGKGNEVDGVETEIFNYLPFYDVDVVFGKDSSALNQIIGPNDDPIPDAMFYGVLPNAERLLEFKPEDSSNFNYLPFYHIQDFSKVNEAIANSLDSQTDDVAPEMFFGVLPNEEMLVGFETDFTTTNEAINGSLASGENEAPKTMFYGVLPNAKRLQDFGQAEPIAFSQEMFSGILPNERKLEDFADMNRKMMEVIEEVAPQTMFYGVLPNSERTQVFQITDEDEEGFVFGGLPFVNPKEVFDVKASAQAVLKSVERQRIEAIAGRPKTTTFEEKAEKPKKAIDEERVRDEVHAILDEYQGFRLLPTYEVKQDFSPEPINKTVDNEEEFFAEVEEAIAQNYGHPLAEDFKRFVYNLENGKPHRVEDFRLENRPNYAKNQRPINAYQPEVTYQKILHEADPISNALDETLNPGDNNDGNLLHALDQDITQEATTARIKPDFAATNKNRGDVMEDLYSDEDLLQIKDLREFPMRGKPTLYTSKLYNPNDTDVNLQDYFYPDFGKRLHPKAP